MRPARHSANVSCISELSTGSQQGATAKSLPPEPLGSRLGDLPDHGIGGHSFTRCWRRSPQQNTRWARSASLGIRIQPLLLSPRSLPVKLQLFFCSTRAWNFNDYVTIGQPDLVGALVAVPPPGRLRVRLVSASVVKRSMRRTCRMQTLLQAMPDGSSSPRSAPSAPVLVQVLWRECW